MNPLQDASTIVDQFERHGASASREACEHFVRQYGTDDKGLMNLYHLINPYIQRYPQEFRDTLRRIECMEDPLSFEDWLYNEYYSGDLHKELWDSWKQEINRVCLVSQGIVEWYVTGCIGGGKTFAALVAQLYKGPYYCACLRDPQTYFGLAKDSEIVFGLFNAILTNATQIDFNQFARFLKNSKWFQDKCPAEIIPSQCLIRWPTKNMAMRIGSSQLHALGANLFSYMIDEVNFMKTPESRESNEHQAYQIYHHASRRMKSRFQKFGVSPGLACIVSSRLATSSFLEDLMEKNKDTPGCAVTDFALWEAKPRTNYSPHMFRVAVGNKYRKSDILDTVVTNGSTDSSYWRIDRSLSQEIPDGTKMLLVPVDFYFDFQRDMDGSLRDIAGIPTYGVHPLIYRAESILECVDSRRKHPFLKEEVTLSMKDQESSLIHYTKWRELCKISQGVWQPLYFPGSPRFIHVDLGLGSENPDRKADCAGIAMGCCYDTYSMTSVDPTTGQMTEEFMPKVWVDFMLRIRPVPGEQIDLGKIVQYIVNLRNYGFWLQRVTFDGFASHMAIQSILKAKLTPPRTSNTRTKPGDELVKTDSFVVSVDKEDKPYRALRDVLFQGAMSYYLYQPFVDEVLALEHTTKKAESGVVKGKVDHPPKGSKDVADAVCGMNWGIMTARAFAPSTPVRESQGDMPRPNVETQLNENVVSDYGPDAQRIRALIPPPKATAPARSYRHRKISTRSNWQADIDGFNRHRL